MIVDAWIQRHREAGWILESAKTLGLDGVTLFASTPSPVGGIPRSIFPSRTLAGLDSLLHPRHHPLRLGWCEWLDTRPAALEMMFRRWENAGARFWQALDLLELDAEEATRAAELDAAMERIEAAIKRARSEGFTGEVAVTLVPSARHQVRLLELAQVVRWQWYVFRRPAAMGAHWSHGLASPAVQIPRWASKALALLEPHQRLEAGLAAYWQDGVAGHVGKPFEAAQAAIQTAAKYTDAACFWSLDWLIKNRVQRALDPSDAVTALTLGEDEELPVGQVEMTRRVQWALVALGEDLGRYGACRDGVDGRWGGRSAAAAARWEERLGLVQDGLADGALLEGLEGALRESGISDDFEGSALEARKRRAG